MTKLKNELWNRLLLEINQPLLERPILNTRSQGSINGFLSQVKPTKVDTSRAMHETPRQFRQ